MRSILSRRQKSPGPGSTLSRDERGAGAVEFALIAPVMLVIAMGMIEFGTIMYTYSSAVSVSQDLARSVAAGRMTTSTASSTAVGRLPHWVQSAATVSVTQSSPTNVSTNRITVLISFPARNATPTTFLQAAYNSTTIQAAATMRQEPTT